MLSRPIVGDPLEEHFRWRPDRRRLPDAHGLAHCHILADVSTAGGVGAEAQGLFAAAGRDGGGDPNDRPRSSLAVSQTKRASP